ncbi:hypothetical protein BC835DRAFT_1421000 [Cytidiella melzeri]|nr:hypothetical protein BC835DRAFT_1421000 [Cytidiella melzeri]
MRDLFTYLSVPPPNFVAPPPTLTDLVPGSARGYPLHQQKKFVVQTVCNNGGSWWYILFLRQQEGNNVPVSICICNPVTVNHVLNHVLQSDVKASAFAVTRLLLSWGVRFNTLQAVTNTVDMLPTPLMPMFFNHIPLGMGCKPHGYVDTPGNRLGAEKRQQPAICAARVILCGKSLHFPSVTSARSSPRARGVRRGHEESAEDPRT